MSQRLIASVYVKHPATHEDLILMPGESPPPEIAALVTNPEAWDVPAAVGGPETKPEAVAVGRPAPVAADPGHKAEDAGMVGVKRAPQRRSRTSTAS